MNSNRRPTIAMRAAAVVHVAGVPAGLANLLASSQVRSQASIAQVVLLDVLLVAVALGLWFAPWSRWPAWAPLCVVPISSIVTVATEQVYSYAAAGAPVDGTTVYVVFMPLWLGFTQRRWSALVLAPFAALPVFVHDAMRNGVENIVSPAGMLVLSIGAAEYIAVVRAREEHLIEHLHRVASLARRLDLTIPGDRLQLHLAEELLEGLAAHEVVAGDARRASRFLARGGAESSASPKRRVAATVQDGNGEPLEVRVLLAAPLAPSARESLGVLLEEVLVRYFEQRGEISVRMRTDALTGLGNRAAADEALERLQAGDAVVLLDIDHFKHINDTFGHGSGDTILKQVAGFLRAQLRARDLVCRLGGDELIVVIRGESDPALAMQAILRRWAAQQPPVTLSAGLAVCRAEEAGRYVLARADDALYAAKRGGRARLCVG